ITVNGQPIPLGTSIIKAQARVSQITAIQQSAVTALNLTDKDVLAAFDIGLVGVQVHAESDLLYIDGQQVTAITLTERVTEVNGVEVVQNDIIQQVFIVHPDGSVIRHPCRMATHSFDHPVRNCLRRLSPAGFLIFALFSATTMALIALSVARCLVFLFGKSVEDLEEGDSEGGYIKKVDFGNVAAKRDEEEEALPEYEKGYAAVNTEEEEK
ncbi:hypothetical protein HDV00_010915, partial [Rhizophlyctis rosea]